MGIDLLKQFLNSKSREIQSKVATKGEPTEEQITAYIATLTDQLFNQVVKGAPESITTPCKSGVAKMLWDLENNCKQEGATLSTSSLLVGLSSILSDVTGGHVVNVVPTAEEMQDISLAANKLWELDTNRLIPGTDYVLNLQKGKKMYDKRDAAADPLFTFVDESVFLKPTYKTFLALLDNYSAATGVAEVVTAEERKENRDFLEAVMATPVMKYCHKYLVGINKAPADHASFVRFLNDLWFKLYRRECANDSSGFEHVFLGEIKNNAVTGLHNWIQLHSEEKRGSLDYMGFITPKRKPGHGGYHLPEDDHHLVTIQFEWNNCIKPCSSSFIGTSPEFELALYTLCFFGGEDVKDIVQCGPYNVEVTCHKYVP